VIIFIVLGSLQPMKAVQRREPHGHTAKMGKTRCAVAQQGKYNVEQHGLQANQWRSACVRDDALMGGLDSRHEHLVLASSCTAVLWLFDARSNAENLR
jgi:hypothetical protein